MSAGLLALAFFHICSLAAACHALLTKHDPRSALGWTAALVFLPVIGLIVYLVFGISRPQSRAEQIMRKVAEISRQLLPPGEAVTAASLPQEEARILATLGRNLTSLDLCGGNEITPLHNGDEAYPAMIAAINAAKEHVFLGTYIFNYGHAARMFIDALEKAHKRGVDVRVLVDGVGQLYSWHKPVKILAEKGIKTTVFRPLRFFPPSFGINLRSHRKLLICDAIGFTGGMNIADGDLLNWDPAKSGKIQDIQFKCQGPVVNQLRRAFLLNWGFCTNEITRLDPISGKGAGSCVCRVVVDGPGDDSEALNDLICGAINIARRKIRIMTPYFLPPLSLCAALKSAGQRGVDVAVILPGHNNLAYMNWATQRVLPQFLEAGVRCWYQAPPFAHTKLLAIDDFYTLIGSANLDYRSLLLNFELNMEIYDKKFNERICLFMDTMIAKGREVFLLDLQKQSLPIRLRNAASWVFSPYF